MIKFEAKKMICRRSQAGDSMVSLLVATTIFSFVAMSIMGLMSVNVLETSKLNSRTDNMMAARFGMDKLARLVRMARNLGDIQGQVPLTSNNYAQAPNGPTGDYFTAIQGDSGVTQAQVNAGTACNTSATFPTVANPDYSSGKPGYATFAGSPWGSSGPLQLSADTLIIQVPVFDASGFPVSSNSGGAGQRVVALDTYVYKVVPDPERTAAAKNEVNYFKLQVCVYPSMSGNTNRPPGMAAGVPQTVMSGIVGPVDPTNPSRCTAFAYINQNPSYAGGQMQTNFNRSTAQGATNEDNLVSFKGIVCNFHLMTMDGAKRVTVMPLRTEMYMRNNQQATMMGPPPAS